MLGEISLAFEVNLGKKFECDTKEPNDMTDIEGHLQA